MVRLIRRAQIDSSDGALVRQWIVDYTNGMRRHAPAGLEVSAWQQGYGEYGIAHWIIDAPDIDTLETFMTTHGGHNDMQEILKRGSSLFLTGHTKDVFLREIPLG